MNFIRSIKGLRIRKYILTAVGVTVPTAVSFIWARSLKAKYVSLQSKDPIQDLTISFDSSNIQSIQHEFDKLYTQLILFKSTRKSFLQDASKHLYPIEWHLQILCWWLNQSTSLLETTMDDLKTSNQLHNWLDDIFVPLQTLESLGLLSFLPISLLKNKIFNVIQLQQSAQAADKAAFKAGVNQNTATPRNLMLQTILNFLVSNWEVQKILLSQTLFISFIIKHDSAIDILTFHHIKRIFLARAMLLNHGA